MPRESKKRLREQSESYLFEIEQINPHYSVHLGHPRFDAGAYGEHLHIEISAKCLAPAKFLARETKFVFIADRSMARELVESRLRQSMPINVGTLTMRGSQSDYLGSLPFDAALALPTIALAGGYRFILLGGSSMYRGSAQIMSSGFYRDIDSEDF